VLKILRNSFLWLILTLIFGLLQVWLVLVHSLIVKSKVFPFEQFVVNGALLFFATAIISSITVDYLLSKKTANYFKPFDVIMFIVFPLLILLCCVALFYMSYDEPLKNLEFELLCFTELAILVMTFCYAIFVKFQAFK
jgi:vacuolar-type H+-ATPase subunit I/STV1